MTDAIQTVYISEGIPSGTPPHIGMAAVRLRRERRRESIIGLSLATANLVLGGFSQKQDDPMRAFRHLFTEDEYDEISRKRLEREQIDAQRSQIEKLRRMFG